MSTQVITPLFNSGLLERHYQVYKHGFAKHPKLEAFITSPAKRKIVRAGRRGGKTTAAAHCAVQGFIHERRVLYAVPTSDQMARFWAEVNWALRDLIGARAVRAVSGLIEWPGKPARIRAKTAWHADSLRGDTCDLLILDEWQLMHESTWDEVGAPMLIDNNGDAIFIYTPPSMHTAGLSKAQDPNHAKKMYAKAMADQSGRWFAAHFPSMDNPFLSRQGLNEVATDMTSLAYRQEILAEDIDEVPGALWTRKLIEKTRVQVCPPLKRCVVAVDPSGSATGTAGIVGVGQGFNDHLYVIQDDSISTPTPRVWASRAVNLYREMKADRIIGERNYGGDMVGSIIESVDSSVPYRDVTATRGKMLRAEPVSARFEKGMIHIVGSMPELEEQCLVAGTLIATIDGDIQIERITAGMLVATREGWKKVLWAGRTGTRPTLKVITDAGIIECTDSHPLHIIDKGFVEANQLTIGDSATCLDTITASPANQSVSLLSTKANAIFSQMMDISGRAVRAAADCCTAIFTKPTTVPSLSATMCTTGITIGKTTTLPISKLSLRKSIMRFTDQRDALSGPVRPKVSIEKKSGSESSPRRKFASSANWNSKLSATALSSAVGRVGTSSITAIIPSGTAKDVYNLHIDGCHEYFANGLLVHNCVTYVPGQPSPDRLDAMVHGCVALITIGMIFGESWTAQNEFTEETMPPNLPLQGAHEARFIVVKYGAATPICFLDVIDDGKTYWIYREHHFDPAVAMRQYTDQEYAAAMKEFIGKITNAEVVLPANCESFGRALRDEGIWFRDAEKEKDDAAVRDTIRMMAGLIGKMKLRVHQRCVNTLSQIQGYQWAEATSAQGVEIPNDEHSECCVAIRTLVAEKCRPWRLE